MIMTSYTSLVVESHRQACSGVISGVAVRFRRKPSLDPDPIARQRDTLALASFPSQALPATEVSDLVRSGQGKYRGAA